MPLVATENGPVRSVPCAPGQDIALVERMLAGADAAYEEFFERHFPGLYGFALPRLGLDADAAEEVVQSTMCRAVAKLGTYRGEAALATWLTAICKREIYDHYRRQGRLKQVALLEDVPEVRTALTRLAGGAETRPEEALRRKEVAGQVRATLEALPSRYGVALEWKYMQGMSVGEIAERLEVGPQAVKSLLFRARDAFRAGFPAVCEG